MPEKDDLPSLDVLKGKISAHKSNATHGKLPEEKPAKMALRLGADLAAGVTVGMVGGWFIDDALGSKPLFMFIGLAVGFVAGMRLMLASAKQSNSSE